MSDGEWRTSWELGDACKLRFGRGGSDAGLTARLRDLRKAKHGGCTVDCRRRPMGSSFVFEYRLVPEPKDFQALLWA